MLHPVAELQGNALAPQPDVLYTKEKKGAVIMTLGQKLLNLRKARGWSQEELANQLNVSRQAVSRWESDSAKPDADNIIALCDLFGVTADYLLCRSDSVPPEAVQAQPSALSSAVRSLSLKQWTGGGAMLAGGLVMLVLKLTYVILGVDYYYVNIYGYVYTGFQGFLHSNELFLLWLLGIVGILWGIIQLIILPYIRRLREEEGFWP